jgi:DNA-directed RNA polymerase sigma subunit (sigma70/sigma32)
LYLPIQELVDQANLDELRKELATLEADERRVSAERRRLHNQIDYGFSSPETVAREREVSDERHRLHERIDALRELLRAEDSEAAGTDPEPQPSALSQWSGISPELVAAENAADDEDEL